jgi:hypothetical protein
LPCLIEPTSAQCGTTVDGEHIDVRGCDLWAFDAEGKIARKDGFWKIRETR